ncbi:hypothetical protein NA66_104320 [Burkholderia pyrrocinia]|uniref:Uncharacterized protein n=2 Tax=Burkholderiaceae TaxID=119060 RepID=A0A318HUE2_BURPY|nr:hypothetical protein NA66_104320 [Burkholderia pyrrocinia]SFW90022.1 hypothetical protein SAMN03159384_06924 [Burkholderia sp. NFACC33-1]SFY46385.1 hypothetical protein SAMN03159408_06920 [Burkholderia sp. NFPP32]
MVRSMVCMVFELVRRLFEECATTYDKRSDIGVCILFMWRHLCAPAQMAVVDPWSIANTLLTERGGPGSGDEALPRGNYPAGSFSYDRLKARVALVNLAIARNPPRLAHRVKFLMAEFGETKGE